MVARRPATPTRRLVVAMLGSFFLLDGTTGGCRFEPVPAARDDASSRCS
jgi:hypothetical protein